MAKEKILPRIEPGSDIVVPCIGGCGASLVLHPSSKEVLPAEGKFTCAKCAGVKTKWKMPDEKAKNVKSRAPGQKTLSDADVEEVDDD